ncbi:hypothetical protein [Actinoplanes friuliensis]|uniref:Transmembrane protein n=1 Tax=Actinoplanes friuliensis DSM 7358 TaxID=1246995 RepID=U5VWV5_9ACTN|nr:hypothetical protein [Actinoplanes friuliensis]AGZ40116.1 hypothetical protein AFR_09135 [Actinoplanes friuliensis DSM 7358]
MRDSAMELRRVVGKFALLLAFVYVLALVAGVVGLVKGTAPVLGFVILLLPAAAFAVSVRDAVRLHQTSDTERMKSLWPRSALYAGIGSGLLIVAIAVIGKMGNS